MTYQKIHIMITHVRIYEELEFHVLLLKIISSYADRRHFAMSA